MKILKIFAILLLIVAGNHTKAATCDSTVWYESFDLLKLQGVNRLAGNSKPKRFPFAEVCFEDGLPKHALLYFSENFTYSRTFEETASILGSQRRYISDQYDYWELEFYPGDSIIAYRFEKKAASRVDRWRIVTKKILKQDKLIWIGSIRGQKFKRYNVEKLLAQPQTFLNLLPDTIKNSYYKSVIDFVNTPPSGYTIKTRSCRIENAHKPNQRLRTFYSSRSCYELGEGVDCAKYAPWLLEGVRVDSVKCNE
jgi:hypothetical protein